MRTSHRLATALAASLCLLGLALPSAAFADDPSASIAPAVASESPTPSATAAVTNITYQRVADPTAVRISWTAPDPDTIYTYTVRILVNDKQQMQATTNTQLDVDNINPGDMVQAFVTATAGGASGSEVAGSKYTQPEPAVAKPSKVTLTQLSKNSLRVTWAPGDSQSQSYLVSLTGGNGASPKQVGGTSIDFTGLTPGYTYTASVTAVADNTGYQSLPSASKKLLLKADFDTTTPSTPAPTVTITTSPSATTTVTSTPTPSVTKQQQQPSPNPSSTATATTKSDPLNTVLLIVGILTVIGIIICTIGLILDKRKQRRGPPPPSTGSTPQV